MSSSAICSSVDVGQLLPDFSFKVKGEEIVEGNSLVVKTTMSSEDVDFIVIDTCTGVRSWGRSTNGGVLVGFVYFISTNSAPLKVLDVEIPSVVQSRLRVVMPSKDEDLVILWGCQSNMLGSSERFLVTNCFLFEPFAVGIAHLHDVDITVWLNLSVLTVLDTSIKEIARTSDEG
jgi:hypothetical protein